MRITFEFGRKGRHTLRTQYAAAQEALATLTQLLVEERAAHEKTRLALAEVSSGAITQELTLMATTQALRVVHGGNVRFPLTVNRAC